MRSISHCKHFISFFVLAIVCAPKSIATEKQPLAEQCSIDLYGDSILHGAYVRKENSSELPGRWDRFPAREIVAQRPKYHINDRTRSGQSLASMAAEFDTKNMKKIVVLGNGIAEGWFGGDVQNILQNLIDVIRANGATPIVTGYARQLPNRYMTSKKLTGRDRVDREAREIAAKSQVAFADFGAVAPVEIMDDVHPNQAYSLRLTERLISTLDKIAPECGAPV